MTRAPLGGLVNLACLLRSLLPVLAAVAAFAAPADAAVIRAEHATGGMLDLVWVPGFATPNNMMATTLDPAHPAYANPSGDHTVAYVINAAPDSGGIVLACTDVLGASDYTWEGWIFTGDGNTRRGLVLRANPANNFQSCYQFVIQAGLFQFNFRRLENMTPTTLGTWFATALPALVQPNTWHRMKVVAQGPNFRCFFDDTELTAAPIVDAVNPTGWVGVYNFRFDLGGVPVYFDDLELSADPATPAAPASWGAIKASYRR
jgi:hypothetical protein